MKYLIVVTFFLFGAMIGQAQSFAGVFVGMDYAQIKPGKHPNLWFEISEKGYTIESITYGIRGEKNISNKFSLLLQLFYTEKEFDADIGFFIPIKGLVFKSYRANMSLKWFLCDNWYVAPGVSLNYLSDMYWYFDYNKDNPTFLASSKKELGGVLSTGYIYKNILLELSYNKGFSIGNKNRDGTNLKPLNSIGILLGYQLQLSKKKRRK